MGSMKTPKFIAFEGLDGCGKSSLIQEIKNSFTLLGLNFVTTREPGGTPLGEELRTLILRTEGQAPTPHTELLLYQSIRSQHVDCVIKPHLEQGYWVLSDRYTASSLAFQCGGRKISETWVKTLNEFSTKGLNPDLNVLLDLSVTQAQKRRQQREALADLKTSASKEKNHTEGDRIEQENSSFHELVRQSFLNQAEKDPHQWLVLDATKPLALLTKELLAHFRFHQWIP
jgi:dTMP kinase